MGWLQRRRGARLFRQAQRLAGSGRLSEAIVRFREAVALDPGDAFRHIHLALALAEEGQSEEALAEARRGVALAPAMPGILLFAGRVHYEAGDFDGARHAFDATLAANPENDLARAYGVLTDWAAGNAEAWRQLAPEDLPDSNPFLVRWLEQIEREMAPMPSSGIGPERRRPSFRPYERRRVTLRPEPQGGRSCV